MTTLYIFLSMGLNVWSIGVQDFLLTAPSVSLSCWASKLWQWHVIWKKIYLCGFSMYKGDQILFDFLLFPLKKAKKINVFSMWALNFWYNFSLRNYSSMFTCNMHFVLLWPSPCLYYDWKYSLFIYYWVSLAIYA